MIVVAGEALVDLVPDVSTTDGEPGPLVPRLGGGPYNVAVAAGRLGAEVAFLSRISTDQFGDALVTRLRTSTVDTSLVQRGDEPTTLAVVGVAGDGSARYSFYTNGTADRLFTDPGPLPDTVTALSFGTLSLALEPGASAYESVLRRNTGALVVLDPNIRDVLIDDPAAYRARFAAWLPMVTVLKLSEEDARWLADGEDAESAALRWLAAGPAAVVLTSGGDGLLVLAGGLRVAVPAGLAAVVDTIGAGDTVHAAVLVWLHRNGVRSADDVRALDAGRWRAALEFAAAAAAVTVSRAGAEPPYAAELPAGMA